MPEKQIGTVGLQVEPTEPSKSGLFDLFEANSPESETVQIQFPNGGMMTFRNYKNLEERHLIAAESSQVAELTLKAIESGFGEYAEVQGLSKADIVACSVMQALCTEEMPLIDWLRAGKRNPTLLAWLMGQVDMAMFGFGRNREMEALESAKKE